MAEFDLFDLTGLVFDPAETNVRKIQAAIEKADKDLGSFLGGEVRTERRDEINAQRAFLARIPAVIFEPDGKKVTQKYKDMAKERTEAEILELRTYVEYLAKTGHKIVMEGDIKQQKRDGRKLDIKNIEKVYLDAGFKIQPSPKAVKPDFPANADKIYDLLKTVRGLPDYRKFYPTQPDNKHVDTLYAFAAYLEGEPDNAAEYKGKLTEELAKILDKHATANATRQEDKRDPLALTIKDLISLGKSNVFNSDANRAKYEKHLLYKRPEMTGLFKTLKPAKKTDLQDPKFAEPAIKMIGDVFGDRDEAITIYNFVTGVVYDPVKPIFYVKCAHCQSTLEFDSVETAKKANRCIQCKAALYKACPSCGELLLEAAERCPKSGCRFVFASAAMFEKYMNVAEQALRDGDFEGARQLLGKAKEANPGEKTRTSELAARIDKEEATYLRPINELRQLVSDRKFMAASQALSRTIANFPKLNVSAFESQIKSAVSKAEAYFEAAKKRSPSECANTCLDILDMCVDFKPAVDFLLSHQPLPVKNLTAAIDRTNCRASINWTRTGEKGVTYRVVRKSGKDAPKNELDCDVVLGEGLNETAFRDDGIPPGAWCTYGVFAKRMGVYSQAESASVLLLAEVTDVRHELNGTNVRITWNLPQNCTGVKVVRSYNGMETLLSDNAQASCEDRGLEYGAKYVYSLRSNYLGHQPSAGISIQITPVPTVDSFSISARQVKDSRYSISWKIPQKDIDLRVLVNKKIFREVKSDAGGCEIELPANGHFVVEVAAYSAGSWVNSTNGEEINTYAPLETDKAATSLAEKPVHDSAGNYKIELSIVLAGAIFGNVTGLYYAVRTKGPSSQQAPWVQADEIGNAPDIKRVDISKYINDGKISHSTTAKGDGAFYLTLFTVYEVNGKEVISDPHKRRIDRPVNASVLWKVSKSLLGKARLSIEVKPNRQIHRIPRLVLCVSDGERLLSHNDAKSEIVLDIPEAELDTPAAIYRNDYEIAKTIRKSSKLFLFSDGANSNEKFVTQWAAGFQGKL